MPTSSSEPTRPWISAQPVVGSVMRERIFSSVLLPAPLRPMMPTTSPCSTSNETSFSAQIRSPARARPVRGSATAAASDAERILVRVSRRSRYACARPSGTACRVRRSADRGLVRAHLRPLGERPLHAPEVERAADENHGRRARRDSDHRPGRRRGAEQRPAEALDHAGHRIDPVQRPPGLRRAGCSGTRSASTNSQNWVRNGTV